MSHLENQRPAFEAPVHCTTAKSGTASSLPSSSDLGLDGDDKRIIIYSTWVVKFCVTYAARKRYVSAGKCVRRFRPNNNNKNNKKMPPRDTDENRGARKSHASSIPSSTIIIIITPVRVRRRNYIMYVPK